MRIVNYVSGGSFHVKFSTSFGSPNACEEKLLLRRVLGSDLDQLEFQFNH